MRIPRTDGPVLLTKLQRFTVATVVPASRKAPVLPFVSAVFVTLTSCSRTLRPAFRKTAPSPLPLVRSKLQAQARGQSHCVPHTIAERAGPRPPVTHTPHPMPCTGLDRDLVLVKVARLNFSAKMASPAVYVSRNAVTHCPPESGLLGHSGTELLVKVHAAREIVSTPERLRLPPRQAALRE